MILYFTHIVVLMEWKARISNKKTRHSQALNQQIQFKGTDLCLPLWHKLHYVDKVIFVATCSSKMKQNKTHCNLAVRHCVGSLICRSRWQTFAKAWLWWFECRWFMNILPKKIQVQANIQKKMPCMLQNLRTLKCKLIYVLCQNTVKPIIVHYYNVVYFISSLNKAHEDTGFLVGIDVWPRLSGNVRGIHIQS